MDDEAFNPVKSVRSHKSQATLQQLLNTGWRVDHSYPSSYVRHEYRKKGQVLSLDSLDLNEDTRFEADEVSSEVMTSTIIVLSRLHRPLVGEPGSSTSGHVRRPAQSNGPLWCWSLGWTHWSLSRHDFCSRRSRRSPGRAHARPTDIRYRFTVENDGIEPVAVGGSTYTVPCRFRYSGPRNVI